VPTGPSAGDARGAPPRGPRFAVILFDQPGDLGGRGSPPHRPGRSSHPLDQVDCAASGSRSGRRKDPGLAPTASARWRWVRPAPAGAVTAQRAAGEAQFGGAGEHWLGEHGRPPIGRDSLP